MMNEITPEKRQLFEDRIKTKFASLAITVWIIYGVYALIFQGQIKGIWSFLLYFFIGIFVASIASILTYLLDYGLNIVVAIMMSALGNIGGFIALFIGGFIALFIKPISFMIQVFWIYIVAKYFLNFINNL